MADRDRDVNEALEGIDAEKRSTLTSLASTPFIAPVVASFAMMGLSVPHAAEAASSSQNPNQTK